VEAKFGASTADAEDVVMRFETGGDLHLSFKLHFPEPEGGIVTVVYPLMLSPR